MDIPTILCVDDDVSVLNGLRRMLRNKGYEILFADSGTEALKILAQTTVSLIISDMRMPEMSGETFLKTVTDRWPKIVQILFTAYAELDAVEQVKLKANVYRLVNKTVDREELLDIVQQALKHYDEHIAVTQTPDTNIDKNNKNA